MHTSLDGFVAGPDGAMDWIIVDEEIFSFVGARTNEADMALYGRITYEMMEGYWPTAADQPNATQHDKEHASWYNRVEKVVLSKTLQGQKPKNTTIISGDLEKNIGEIKHSEGGNIIIFGSPTASHALMRAGLIDDFWLFVNPLVLGEGVPLFDGITEKIPLTLAQSQVFSSGVVSLLYERRSPVKDRV